MTGKRYHEPALILLFIYPVRQLSLCKGSTGSLPAVTGSAPFDIHMVCRALVIAVMETVGRLTVDANDLAWMFNCTGKAVSPCLRKAFAAGFILAAGALSAYHNISLTTALASVVGTVIHRTS